MQASDLPSWKDCCKKKKAGAPMSSLEIFIYHNEPAEVAVEGFQTPAEFRDGLAAVVTDCRAGGEEALQK